jgi:hypothetical protein
MEEAAAADRTDTDAEGVAAATAGSAIDGRALLLLPLAVGVSTLAPTNACTDAAGTALR